MKLLVLLLAVISCSPEIASIGSPAQCKDLPCGMTTPINPTTPPTWPLTLTGPSDGEVATSSTVNGPFLSLINASESARLITYGQTRRYMTLDNAGNLSVGPLIAVTLKTGGVWQTYSSSVPITKALSGLTANILYNVYVYYSAGLQIQVGLDPVDSTRSYKDGDEGYVFVGYVLVDSFGNTVPATFNGTTYTYYSLSVSGGGVDGNLVLDGGSATGVTVSVPLTPCVPPYALSATLYAVGQLAGVGSSFVVGSDAGKNILAMQIAGLVGPSQLALSALAPFQNNPRVEYTVGTGADVLYLYVTSFTI